MKDVFLQMLPEKYKSPNVTPLIVVISPLVSLMHDQKAEMTKYSLEVVNASAEGELGKSEQLIFRYQKTKQT